MAWKVREVSLSAVCDGSLDTREQNWDAQRSDSTQCGLAWQDPVECDDLPSMDNDDFRRGKLSTHKKFNEATAILAGDALHDLAFELISGNLYSKNNKSKLELINYLSLSIGHKGLALGQNLDLEFENKKHSKNEILNMYSRKTGKLFEYSFSAPFILKDKSKTDIHFAKEYD